MNDIAQALDSKLDWVALFIDLSKAFDMVDHTILLERLHNIGFDYNSCKWVDNYLSDRSQAVTGNGFISEFLNIYKGVPQCSVLGPLLFSIYINDFNCGVTNSLIHLYADDSIIYSFAPSVEQALNNLQDDFCIIQRTLSNLKLVLNPGKSKYMIFTKRRTVDLNKFTLNTEDGSPLERVSCYKYLGIWLDDKLSFNLHVAELLKKLKPLLSSSAL